ncbi:AP-1 complex subunit gamma-1 [Alternaria alternata]|nr:AP-1 complex subunit gamma-1 [Alternaria alternata]
MSEAAGLSALRRQALGIPGDHVVAGREPGSLDAGDQLAQEVGPDQKHLCKSDANWCAAT